MIDDQPINMAYETRYLTGRCKISAPVGHVGGWQCVKAKATIS
jgi:hypothetical protein